MYDVILADPPWYYNKRNNPNTKFGLGAGGHYSVMPLDGILNMGMFASQDLPSIRMLANDNAVLFLWSTCPHLKDAVRVIDFWGFRYCTVAFVWVKTTKDGSKYLHLPGYYTSSNVELVLLGARGSMEPAVPMLSQIVEAPRLAHSEKPKMVRDRINLMYPNARKIELFARKRVEDWDAWGNEV